jgi:hypothetical protein
VGKALSPVWVRRPERQPVPRQVGGELLRHPAPDPEAGNDDEEPPQKMRLR